MLQQHKWQYLAAIALTALFMACGSKKGEEAKDGFFAAKAAKAYYEQLVKGKFDAYFLFFQKKSDTLNTSKEFVLIIFENVYFEDALFLFLLFD